MYSQEELIVLNPVYHQEHGVSLSDVAKINNLVTLIEAERQIDPPQPIDGDRVICVSPKKGIVSKQGHLQRRNSFGEFTTVCTQPYTPFIGTSLYSDASGGYWVSLEESDLALFTFKHHEKKTFCAWGHVGMVRNGAIDFQAEVFVWELTHTSFY